MKTLEELQDLIEEKQEEINSFELDPDNYEDSYDDMLNDCYPEVFNILPARILSECDPIAYNCGLSDYIDSLELDDDDDYKTLLEELEELEEELYDLEE